MSESRDARGRDTSGDLGPLMELVCLATARKGTRHFPLFALSFSLPFFFFFFFFFFFSFVALRRCFFSPFRGESSSNRFPAFSGSPFRRMSANGAPACAGPVAALGTRVTNSHASSGKIVIFFVSVKTEEFTGIFAK